MKIHAKQWDWPKFIYRLTINQPNLIISNRRSVFMEEETKEIFPISRSFCGETNEGLLPAEDKGKIKPD